MTSWMEDELHPRLPRSASESLEAVVCAPKRAGQCKRSPSRITLDARVADLLHIA